MLTPLKTILPPDFVLLRRQILDMPRLDRTIQADEIGPLVVPCTHPVTHQAQQVIYPLYIRVAATGPKYRRS